MLEVSESLLGSKLSNLSEIDRTWIEGQITALQDMMFNNENAWNWRPEWSQAQVQHLASLMPRDREDRLELLSILVGFNVIDEETGVPSSRDSRITKWMFSILIDYFKVNPNAKRLVGLLGF